MASIVNFDLAAYQEAAHKFRSELLTLPVIGAKETLQYFTGRPGVRYKESVGYAGYEAQIAPYKRDRVSTPDLNITFRTLETYFGSVVTSFDPNSAITTLLGAQAASQGEGIKQALSAQAVLGLIAKSISKNLNNAIWSGVRNENGDTTADLFDGFDTITSAEITAGKISTANHNLLDLTSIDAEHDNAVIPAEITDENALDIAKQIYYSLSPELQMQVCYLFCSPDFVNKYNEAYLANHGGIIMPGNEYNQTVVEGSNGKLILCPLVNKANSSYFHVSPKDNMLYGYDTQSDDLRVDVEKYHPFLLTFVATMFFGVQFESIAPERLKVVKIA